MRGLTRLVVPVKQAAALDDAFEPADDRRPDPADLDWELNEWDASSLEAALELRDAAGGGEVVVVSVGGDEAEEGLRGCLARGADRATRLWDDVLAGADPLAVARALAAVVQLERPDLVLCGAQSSDGVNGATGVALAAHLQLPRVAVVRKLEYDTASRIARVERELEGGRIELLEVECPSLLTIQTGINAPRYATLRAIKQADAKPLNVVTLADIGLDAEAIRAAAGSRTRGLWPARRSAGAEMLSGSPGEVAARIASIVRERLAR